MTFEVNHLAGLFHLHSFLSLCWDERRVRLDSEDDEQLWRMMFRRGGMQRLEFKHAQKLGRQVDNQLHTSRTGTFVMCVNRSMLVGVILQTHQTFQHRGLHVCVPRHLKI